MITGIVVALPEELSTITAIKIAKGNCEVINDKLLVAYSGAGSENAQRAAQLLVSKGVTRLISWGCAAALGDHLKPGDLILAADLIAADSSKCQIDSAWHHACQNLLPKYLTVHTGSLVESKSLVSSAQEKQQIHLNTAAVALDMESVAVAKVAEQHKLPCLVVRAIADPVSMDLPKAVSFALNTDGDVELNKLLLFLAGHPGELPGLIKLAWHFHAAKKTLLVVARQLDGIVNFNVNTSYA